MKTHLLAIIILILILGFGYAMYNYENIVLSIIGGIVIVCIAGALYALCYRAAKFLKGNL